MAHKLLYIKTKSYLASEKIDQFTKLHKDSCENHFLLKMKGFAYLQYIFN